VFFVSSHIVMFLTKSVSHVKVITSGIFARPNIVYIFTHRYILIENISISKLFYILYKNVLKEQFYILYKYIGLIQI